MRLTQKLEEMRSAQAATRANWANGAALFSEQQWADAIAHGRRLYASIRGLHQNIRSMQQRPAIWRNNVLHCLTDGEDGVEVWVDGVKRMTIL